MLGELTVQLGADSADDPVGKQAQPRGRAGATPAPPRPPRPPRETFDDPWTLLGSRCATPGAQTLGQTQAYADSRAARQAKTRASSAAARRRAATGGHRHKRLRVRLRKRLYQAHRDTLRQAADRVKRAEDFRRERRIFP